MPATYLAHGRGRSLNACAAEREGKRPWTRFAREYGLRPAARDLLTPSEWHHVGKYASACDYYDPSDLPDLYAENPEVFTPRGAAIILGMIAEQTAQELEARAKEIARSFAYHRQWPTRWAEVTEGDLHFHAAPLCKGFLRRAGMGLRIGGNIRGHRDTRNVQVPVRLLPCPATN